MRLNNLSRFAVQMRNVHYYLLLIGISWSGALAALALMWAVFKWVVA